MTTFQVLSRATGAVEGRYCFVWTGSVEQAATARHALDKFNLNGHILQVWRRAGWCARRTAQPQQHGCRPRPMHSTCVCVCVRARVAPLLLPS